MSAIPNGPDIVFDTNQALTLTDFCNSLPPKAVVDKLLSVYFNAKHVQARKHALLTVGLFIDQCSSCPLQQFLREACLLSLIHCKGTDYFF